MWVGSGREDVPLNPITFVCATCGRAWVQGLHEPELFDWQTIVGEGGLWDARCPRHHNPDTAILGGQRWDRQARIRALRARTRDIDRYGYAPPGLEAPFPIPIDNRLAGLRTKDWFDAQGNLVPSPRP